MGKDVKKRSASRRSQTYSLMLVGNDGSLKQLRGVKFLLTLFLFLLTLAIVTAATLFILYDQKNRENARLKSAINALLVQQKAIDTEESLSPQKLITLNPAAIKPNANHRPENASKSATADKPSGETENDPLADTTPDLKESLETVETDEGTEESTPSAQLATAIDADEFIVTKGRNQKELNIRLNILNISPDIGQITGHVIVVLKPDLTNDKGWVASPSVELANGKPTGMQLGQTFAISRFKTVYFKVNTLVNADAYTAATVYLFTRAGELLLEKNFPISLN